MRRGFALPQIGSVAGPDALITVAKRAEALGFDSVWVLDRLLFPVEPRAPYPVGDGTLPAKYQRTLDLVETLTFVAAHTSRVAVGTSVLNVPWYDPVLLARRLSTLDVLSGGRLRVGLGMGWSPDEYEAAGVPWQDRGKRADECIRVLKTYLDDGSGGVPGHILSDPQIHHRSEASPETAPADIHGRVYAVRPGANCAGGERLVPGRHSDRGSRADVRARSKGWRRRPAATRPR